MSVSAAELKLVITAQEQVSAALKSAGGSVAAFGQQVDSVGSRVGAQFAQVGKAVALAGVAIGGGLAAGAAAGVKAAGDLQQSVANISTIAPSIDTTQVFDALNQMQQRVPQTAAQLGDSLYNVFSSISDLTADQALALTETFAKGAVGAQTDAETFGTAIIGVLNAYKLSTEDATHVSDVFFNTVAAGVVTGEELAASLGPVTQAAKAAGVPIDDLGGLIAGVTKEGGPAAQNINNLNNFLQKFTTTKAQNALKDIGVATVDAAGNFRPIMEVMADLRKETAHLAEADMASLLQDMFPDMQARQGAQTILSQLDFINSAIETNRTSAGSAASAFQKMNQTLNSQLKIAQNTITSVLTTIGAELLPAITPLLVAFSTQLPGAIQSARTAFANLSVAGTPLIQFFQDLWGTVQAVFSGDWSPDASVNPVINALGNLAGIVRDVIIPNLLSLGTIAQRVVSGDLVGAFAEVGPILQRAGNAFGPILAGWAEAFGAWVGPATQSMLAQLATLGSAGLAWVQSQLPGWMTQLQAWGAQFTAWIQPQIGPMLARLQALAQQALSWVASQAPAYAAALIQWGREFFEWVAPQVPGMLRELTALAKQAISWIADQVPTIVAQLAAWGLAFVGWVARDAIPKIVPELLKFQAAVGNWIVTQGAPALGKTALEIGLAMVTGILQGVANLQARLGAVVASAAIGALNEAKSALGIRSPSTLAAREVGVPIAEGVIAGFVQRMGGDSTMAEAVRAVVTTALKYGIDPLIALALAKAESGLRPGAVGDKGASVGLFQLHSAGQGAGMSVAERSDPWRNAEVFLRDKKALFDKIVAEGLTGADLATKFGGLAEVSAKEFWYRYGQAYTALAGQYGPELANLTGAALVPGAAGGAMQEDWTIKRLADYKRLLEEVAPPAASSTEALARLAAAMGQVQAQVANPATGIANGMAGMSAQIVQLARNTGIGTAAFDEWAAGNISAASALDVVIQEAAKIDPAFQALADAVNSTGGSTDETRLAFLNLLAAWKPTAAAAGDVATAVSDVGSATGSETGAMIESWRAVAASVDEARDQLRRYGDFIFELSPERLKEQSGGWTEIGDQVLRAAEAVRRYNAAVEDAEPLPSGVADLEDAPKAHSGAYVREGGLAELEAGETVLTAEQRAAGGGDTYVTNNYNSLHVHPRPGEEHQVYSNFRIMSALFGGS